MSIALRNGIVAFALGCALVFAVRRRGWNPMTVLFGFLVLDFAADASLLWLAPGVHHEIGVWLARNGDGIP